MNKAKIYECSNIEEVKNLMAKLHLDGARWNDGQSMLDSKSELDSINVYFNKGECVCLRVDNYNRVQFACRSYYARYRQYDADERVTSTYTIAANVSLPNAPEALLLL